MFGTIRTILRVTGLSALIFLLCALILGRPKAKEPRFMRRIRYSMWGEFMGLFGYGLWHPRLLFPGSTDAEKRMHLPGDGLIRAPTASTTFAITVNAPAQEIWPWLLQMGAGRALWYAWSPLHTYPEFQEHISPYHIEPKWQDLHVGDILLDGDALNKSDETRGAWRVVEIHDCRAIVFYSARDLVEGREFNAEHTRALGITAVVSWVFYINPVTAEQSRLLIRERAYVRPIVLVPLARLVFGNGDKVFERTILEGIKYRVERCGSGKPQALPKEVYA